MQELARLHRLLKENGPSVELYLEADKILKRAPIENLVKAEIFLGKTQGKK